MSSYRRQHQPNHACNEEPAMPSCDPTILTTYAPHTMMPDLNCVCPACRIRRARYGSNQITAPFPCDDPGPPRLNLDFTRPDHPTHFPLLNMNQYMANVADVGSGYMFFPPFGTYDLAPRTQADAYYADEAENVEIGQDNEMDNISVTAVKDVDLSDLADIVPNPTLASAVAAARENQPSRSLSTDAITNLSRATMDPVPRNMDTAPTPGPRTSVAPAPAAGTANMTPHLVPSATGLSLRMDMQGQWDHECPATRAPDFVPVPTSSPALAVNSPTPKAADTTLPRVRKFDLLPTSTSRGPPRRRFLRDYVRRADTPTASGKLVPVVKPSPVAMAADSTSLAQVTIATDVAPASATKKAPGSVNKAKSVKWSDAPTAGSKPAPPPKAMDSVHTPISSHTIPEHILEAMRNRDILSARSPKAVDPAPQHAVEAISIVPPKVPKELVPKKAKEAAEKESIDVEWECRKIRKEIETMDKLIESLGKVSLEEKTKGKEEMHPDVEMAAEKVGSLNRDDGEDAISEGWETVVDPDKEEWEMVEDVKS